jgi:hypothetical protein
MAVAYEAARDLTSDVRKRTWQLRLRGVKHTLSAIVHEWFSYPFTLSRRCLAGAVVETKWPTP